jgi:hypothetical protein
VTARIYTTTELENGALGVSACDVMSTLGLSRVARSAHLELHPALVSDPWARRKAIALLTESLGGPLNDPDTTDEALAWPT